MIQNKNTFFDDGFREEERLPREFMVSFHEVKDGARSKIKVSVNGVQSGDLIDDNSNHTDFYRFHDIFHYTFAAMLGWSPCTRAMLKVKRRSNFQVDEIEDGARATITEEAISLMIFNEAKKKNYFRSNREVSTHLLKQIKEMTAAFEVSIRTEEEWKLAILKGYELFYELKENNGGKVNFDMIDKSAIFEN